MTRLIGTCSAFAGALLAVISLTVAPAADADDSWLLPDLRQGPIGCTGGYGGDPRQCTDWDVCMVTDANAPNGECVSDGPIHAVRLRFTSTEDNVGDGPLLLYGHRDNTDQPKMTVRQAFAVSGQDYLPDSYASAQRDTSTFTYYEPAPMHQHWHLMGFEHFQLRTPHGATLVADRKNGFCLGDRYPTFDANSLSYTPHDENSPTGMLARYLRDNGCEYQNPSVLDVTEGISVGSGDDYRYLVDFQWLDITGVPSGVYDVVNTANADHTLLEKNYDNNSSSIAIFIQWPNGASTAPTVITAPPTVRLLRSCPGSAQCAASGS